jgi:putative transposase
VFKGTYDAEVCLPTLISKVTVAVKEPVAEWQNCPLYALHPIIYLDCIVVKTHAVVSMINKIVFLALGINTKSQKELLGMWLEENKETKFQLSVLTAIKNHKVFRTY